VSEGEKSKVAAEGGEESTGLRAKTTEGVGTGRDPSKGGSAGPTAAMVRGALLLEPVEEKNSPHRVPNLKGEEWARSGSLPNADGLPRVVRPLMGDGRNDKEEVIAGDRLLAWEGGNHANIGTSGPCIESSSIENLPRCGGIKGSRVAKIAEGWERWCEGGKAEATQSM